MRPANPAFISGAAPELSRVTTEPGTANYAYGVLIFYTIVASGLGRLSPVFVYVVAILASLIVSIPWLKSKLLLPAD